MQMKWLAFARGDGVDIHPRQARDACGRDADGRLLHCLAPGGVAQRRVALFDMTAGEEPASKTMVMNQQNPFAIGMQHQRRTRDVAGLKLMARKRRLGLIKQRENQLAAFFFFRKCGKGGCEAPDFAGGRHSRFQNSMAARTSEGGLSKARQIASRLSMLGRLAPRSMELICEMLSLVAAARSLSDQSRSTRSILM